MTPQEAYDKARNLGKRIPKLEPAISKDAQFSYLYAKYVIEGIFILAEPTISKYAQFSYYYAREVIEGRWEIGEPIISKDAFYSYLYSFYVIKGRLPDFMHNALLLSNDKFTKKYVEFIK